MRGLTALLVQGGLGADIRAVGLDRPLVTTIEASAGSSVAELLVPLHPVRRLEGGPVDVVISAGGITCPALPLVVEPVPAAPGEMTRAMVVLEELLLPQVAAFGTSVDVLLRARTDTLRAELQPLAATLQAIRGPGNPNSLAAIRAGTAPILGGVAPDFALVDAMLASAGFVDGLRRLGAAGARQGQPSLYGAMAPGIPVPAPRQPETPAQLDALMSEQGTYEGLTTGAAADFFTLTGVALGTTGILSYFLGPVGVPISAATSAAAMGLTVTVLYLKTMAGVLPATLLPLSLAGQPDRFAEDDPSRVGFWIGRASATSTGASFTIPELLGALPGIGSVTSVVRTAALRAPALNDFTVAAADYAAAVILSAWGVSAGGVIEVTRTTWGPVVVQPARDGAFFDWTVSGDAFSLSPREAQYRAERVGVSQLRLVTRSPRFRDQARAGEARLEVLPITVRVRGPDGFNRIDLQPGQTVSFDAIVENAVSTCVTWRASAGQVTGTGTCNAPAARYVAPATPGTYTVEAESASRLGLRASGVPPRVGTMIVRVGGLQLTPRPQCVRPGQVVAFSATLAGAPVNFADLVSIVTNGSLTLDGRYTAGTVGTGRLRVALADNPAITDDVEFRIAEVCTGWTLTVSGARIYAGQGSCVRHQPGIATGDPLAPLANGRPRGFYIFGRDVQFQAVTSDPLGIPLGPEGGAPAQSNAFAAVGLFFGDDAFIADPAARPTVSFTWTRDPTSPLFTVLTGRFTGTLYRNPPSSGSNRPQDPITFRLDFDGMPRATLPELVSQACATGAVAPVLR